MGLTYAAFPAADQEESHLFPGIFAKLRPNFHETEIQTL